MATARKRRQTYQSESDGWTSVLAASKDLEISRHAVLLAIAAGELRSQLIAGRTVVSRESIDQLKAKRAEGGR